MQRFLLPFSRWYNWLLFTLCILLFSSSIIYWSIKYLDPLPSPQNGESVAADSLDQNKNEDRLSISQLPTQALWLREYYEDEELVTFETFIPLLWEKYADKEEFQSQNIDFSYISSESVLYKAFVYWYQEWMIGVDIDPERILRCKNLAVLVWLAQSRTVQYTPDTVVDVFWEEAKKRWILWNKCEEKDQKVYGSNLT